MKNIPIKTGEYTDTIGDKTIKITITPVALRMNRGDMIAAGMRSRVGGYKQGKRFDIELTDSEGNVVMRNYFEDEFKYKEFMGELIARESGTNVNPTDFLQKFVFKIQKGANVYVKEFKFMGLKDNAVKGKLFIDDWLLNGSGSYKADYLVDVFERMGIKYKIAPTKKGVRGSNCFVVTVLVPFDFDLNEGKKKRIERIINEMVRSEISKML